MRQCPWPENKINDSYFSLDGIWWRVIMDIYPQMLDK